jgi:hypothetical protein
MSGILGIDPATGQALAPPPATGFGAMLSDPMNLAVLGGGALYGRRKLNQRAAKRALEMSTAGVSNGAASRQAISGIASQGAASRAGLLSRIMGPSASTTAASAAPAAPAIQQMIGGPGQLAALRAPTVPRIGLEFAQGPMLGQTLPSAPSSAFTSRALSSPWAAPAAVDTAAAGGGLRAAAVSRFPGLASGARVGAGGLAATLAGMGVDRLNIGGANSILDQAATGAAAGGTFGTVVGGPFGGLIGAGVGGVGNVGYNKVADALWRKDKPKPAQIIDTNRATLAEAMATYNLSAEQRSQLMAQYDVALIAAGKSDKKRAEASSTAATQLLGAMPQYVQGLYGAAQQRRNDQSQTAALQQWVQPQLAQQQAAAEVQAASYRELAGAARNDAEARYFTLMADNALRSAANQGVAFSSQLAMLPQSTALARQQQEQDAIAAQLAQQVQAQQVAALMGQSSGAGDLASLMQ